MKVIGIIFLTFSLCFSANAQYNEGVYVTDTLYDGVYGSIAFCAPSPDVILFVDSTLFTNVAGLNYHFIVTGVSALGIGSPAIGPFAVGDTLPLSPGVVYPIFFPNGGTLNYILQAYGTPQIANEIYYCDIGFLFTLGSCDNGAYFYPDSLGSQCTVGAVGVEEQSEQRLKVYPNPAVDQIFLDNAEFGIEYSVIDIKGTEILRGQYIDEPVNVSELAPGPYTVLTRSWMGSSSLRFLKLDIE